MLLYFGKRFSNLWKTFCKLVHVVVCLINLTDWVWIGQFMHATLLHSLGIQSSLEIQNTNYTCVYFVFNSCCIVNGGIKIYSNQWYFLWIYSCDCWQLFTTSSLLVLWGIYRKMILPELEFTVQLFKDKFLIIHVVDVYAFLFKMIIMVYYFLCIVLCKTRDEHSSRITAYCFCMPSLPSRNDKCHKEIQ